jgi:hypothetical protein
VTPVKKLILFVRSAAAAIQTQVKFPNPPV